MLADDVLTVLVERPADAPVVVRVAGEVDADTAPRLAAALRAARPCGDPLVVDLGRVTFLGAAGVRVLADAVRTGPTDLVCRPGGGAWRVLSLLGEDWPVRCA